MSFAWHDRESACLEPLPDLPRTVLLARPLDLRCLEMADRCGRGRADRRWKGGRENEARRIGAKRVNHPSTSCNVATEAAERLGEGAFDHVDAVHDAVARGYTRPARTVHADRVNLVEVGHGAIAVGEITDPMDRRDVAAHRVETLENDQFWAIEHVRPATAFRDGRHRCGGRSASRHRPA